MTASLISLLRATALKHQGAEARPFYPLREVSWQLGIPLSVVSRVYRQLEDEGLLSRIRGSQTILQGKAASKRLMVRGFVGIPASVNQFRMVLEYQNFVIEIRRELWRRGFAASNAFFEARERDPRILSRRILHRGVETAIWYRPEKVARETAAFLEDKGIRVIGISEGDAPAIPCRYRVNREKALRQAVTRWTREAGIDRYTLLRGGDGWGGVGSSRTEKVLEESGGHYDSIRLEPDRLSSTLGRLKRERNRGLILLSSGAAFLSQRAPEKLAELASAGRVLLLHGPMIVHAVETQTRAAVVDVVSVNWPKLAGRIVDDLVAAKNGGDEVTVLDAELQSRVPLASLS